jgi:hypothetical protein
MDGVAVVLVRLLHREVDTGQALQYVYKEEG